MNQALNDKCLVLEQFLLLPQGNGRPPCMPIGKFFKNLGVKIEFVKVHLLPINRGGPYSFFTTSSQNLAIFLPIQNRERRVRGSQEKMKIFLSQA